MITLNPAEARVLGVLVEKALTTPDQYPLSLNAVVNGANQKNNRDPVLSMTEDEAFEALEGLRTKAMVVRVDQANSRVHKYRHNAIDTLRVRTGEVAVLAELLLRGPQTLGELRGRASRMHPMDTLDVVKDLLRALSERPEPFVKELPPSPGSRAERYTQLLCAECHPQTDVPSHEVRPAMARETAGATGGGESAKLLTRIESLEAEVAQLRGAIRSLAQSVGEGDPFEGISSKTPSNSV